MVYIKKLWTTCCLIRYSLVPGKRVDSSGLSADHDDTIFLEAFATVFAGIENRLRSDGTLELYFIDALSPAAPFLLYRMKSDGFSACRAVILPKGILLTARR